MRRASCHASVLASKLWRQRGQTAVHVAAPELDEKQTAADVVAMHRALVPAAADPRPVPDRLTLWPVDDGRYGLDATFQGASGYVNAQRHEDVMRLADVDYSFRQELEGSWTLRLGPFPAAQARQAIDSFLGL